MIPMKKKVYKYLRSFIKIPTNNSNKNIKVTATKVTKLFLWINFNIYYILMFF